MNLELAIAGLCWFVLAFGHMMIGLRWVVPALAEIRLPATPFGPPAMTRSMVRFSWNIISVMLVGFGILLTILAFDSHPDARDLLLKWFVAFVLVGIALSFWEARNRPRRLLRLPVPLAFAVIAVMCWIAAT